MTRPVIALIGLVCAGWLWPSAGFAAPFCWTNSAGGSFNAAGNWDAGSVPGAGDDVFFTNNASYAVTWSASITNNNATFNGFGTVTNTIGAGRTWVLQNSCIVTGATGPAFSHEVHLNSGTMIVTNAAGTGTLFVGTNASFKLRGDSTADTLTVDILIVTNRAYLKLFRGTLNTLHGFYFAADCAGSAEFGDSALFVWNMTGGTNLCLRTDSPMYLIYLTTLNVVGPGTLFTNASGIVVGHTVGGNLMVVTNGARVYCNGDGWLGKHATSIGNNTVRVTGSNSLWWMAGALQLGNGTSINRFTVADAAVVQAAGAAMGLESTAAGTNSISVEGGSLYVTNSAGTAAFNVRRGALNITNGLVVTDNLLMTNGLQSVIAFHSGTLSIRNSTVSNNSAFTAGNGVNPAGLELRGGTHAFYNGLTIATNAALSPLVSGVATSTLNGSLTLQEGAIYNWEYGAAGADLVDVNGTLTLPTIATLNVTNLGGGTLPGLPVLFTADTLAGNQAPRWNISGVTGLVVRVVDTNVVLTALPSGTIVMIR